MPPSVGQPAVPNPYGYYGQQYGSQQAGSPTTATQSSGGMPPPPHYANAHPPLPPTVAGPGSSLSSPSPSLTPSMGAWTEHLTPEGLRYYYNPQTGTSSWEMPPELQVRSELNWTELNVLVLPSELHVRSEEAL